MENERLNLKKNLFSLRTLSGFAVGGIIFYYFFKNFNFQSAIETLSEAKWHFVLLGAIFYYISIPIRGLRWRLQLKPVGHNISYRPLTHYYYLSMFANAILPARMGDLYRAYLAKKNQSVSMSMSLGVFFSERVFDLVVISILVIFSGTFYWSVISGTREGDYLVFGFMAVLLILVFFIASLRGLPYLVKFAPEKIKDKLERFHKGLFKYPAQLPVILGATILIWLCEALRLYFVFLAFGVDAGFLMALFVSQASLILMAVPISPAGLGIVELLMLKILSLSGISPDLAGALTITDRLISYWSVVGFGGLCYLFSARLR